MIKAVIFDCFGVLVPNASGLFLERHLDLMGGNSKFMDDLNIELDYDRMKRAEFFEALAKQTGLPVEQIRTEIYDALVVNTELVEYIKGLKSKYKVGLLSNASSEEIAVIDEAGIGDLFDGRVVSAEAQITKPSPEIYTLCADRLGVKPSDCVFIDDSAHNLPAAEALGMKTILYKDFDDFVNQFEALQD